jgi:alpha-beta hydrolase superfamily lysophospholipase
LTGAVVIALVVVGVSAAIAWSFLTVRTWQVFLGAAYQSTVDGRRPTMRLHGERRMVPARDGVSLSYWYLQGHLPVMVVLSWGYRCQAEESMPLAAQINAAGFPVAMVRWRGCNREDGAEVTWGVREHEDLVDIVADVRSRHPDLPVVLVGRSFGAGMSILAASRAADVEALWLDGPFRDPVSVMCDAVHRKLHLRVGPLIAWPLAWWARLRRGLRLGALRVDRAARHLPRVPVRVLMYTEDKLVPPGRSMAVADAAGWTAADIQWVRGLGHAFSFENDPAAYVEMLAEFIRSQVLAAPCPAPSVRA